MTPPASAASAHTGHVLIVDDDSFSRVLLREMLRAAGRADVVEAGDGHQALQQFDRGDRPELILCDLQMPTMDGIEFLRHLAARRYSGRLCLLSGTQRPLLEAAQRLAHAQRLQVVCVLEKPISEAAVRMLLTAGQPNGSAHEPVAEEGTVAPPAPVELTADELREGLAQDRIELLFQPKVTVDDYRPVGAECLARFRHPQGALLGPAAFVPLAERHGLIDALTLEVLRKAARQLSAWDDRVDRFKLSVNVSMLSLHRLDMPEIFESIVREANLSPSDFMLEITESALPQDFVVGLDILLRLRLKGFQLSLDDFGTGFSTMQSLGQLPFCELKLDQQFVQGALHDEKARTILESSVQLGHALKLDLVAEGVETPSEWTLVERLKCDQVQGYHVARPMPGPLVDGWITQWHAGPRT